MTIANAKITRYNATHIMGTAMLTHGKGTEEVQFVAPAPSPESKPLDVYAEQQLDNSARFFSSPMIARTNFDDLSAGTELTPAFVGRDLGTMQAHLAKNFKS